MFNRTVTLFNYHAGSGSWYLSVIAGVYFVSTKSRSATSFSVVNADTIQLLMPCKPDRSVITGYGDAKSYIGPKEYAACTAPEEMFTFRPETDFIYDGVWPDLEPIAEDDFVSGLYHELNDAHDGIYLITSAVFYPLLPHFEIGGR